MKRKYLLITLLLVLLALSILNSKVTMTSALNAVTLWAFNVMPSLFPFFIISQVLLLLGFAQKFGKLFTPLMQLLDLPAVGAYPFAMSLLCGFPNGARICGQLYERKEITLPQCQALAVLCHTSGPLFVIGTVATAFFKTPQLGGVILLLHFLAVFCNGCLFSLLPRNKFLKASNPQPLPDNAKPAKHNLSVDGPLKGGKFFARRAKGLHNGKILATRKSNAESAPADAERAKRLADPSLYNKNTLGADSSQGASDTKGPGTAPASEPLNIGRLFGDAINTSLTALLLICGFMVISGIIIGFLQHYKLLPDNALGSLIAGALEITNGLAHLAGEKEPLAAIPLICCILGFSGLSIIMQALAFLPKSLSVPYFVLSRLSCGLVSLYFGYLFTKTQSLVPVVVITFSAAVLAALIKRLYLGRTARLAKLQRKKTKA